MTFSASAVALAMIVASAPEAEAPVVQRPGQSKPAAVRPEEAQPERAIAEEPPTPMEASEPAPEPALVEPAPETSPPPTTAAPPEVGSAPSERPAGVSAPPSVSDAQAIPLSSAPPLVSDAPYAAPLDMAPPSGVGFYIVAGSILGAVGIKQLGSKVFCADFNCDWPGYSDRALVTVGIAFAGLGGAMQGNHLAWKDSKSNAMPRKSNTRKAAGWTMFAVGAGLLIMDSTFLGLCYDQGRGPYVTDDEGGAFVYRCTTGWSSLTLDVGAGLTGSGLGLALSGHRYAKKRDEYDKANVAVAPMFGGGRYGLGIAARF